MQQFNIDDIVSHNYFGKGKVVALHKDFADVLFPKFGKKSIIYSALVKEADFKPKETSNIKTITQTEVIEFFIEYMNQRETRWVYFEWAYSICKARINQHLKEEDAKSALCASSGTVFLKQITHVLELIKKGKLTNKKYIIEEKNDTSLVPPKKESPKREVTCSVDDFEKASIKESFYTTVKLFFARSIIKFAVGRKDENIKTLFIKDIAKTIMDDFSYQISVGNFKNDLHSENPPFYSLLHDDILNNRLFESEKEKIIGIISDYLLEDIVGDFLLIDGEESQSIYSLDLNNNLLFTNGFLTKLKNASADLDKRIVNRIGYFITKNNDSNLAKAYYQNLLRHNDKNGPVLKFDYNENLNLMKTALTEEIYLKSDFKKIMKEYGIPNTETYLRMCLDRIDYSQRTKHVILSSNYSTLKSYYREQVCKHDVYRYSNPLNIDEYDKTIKSLISDLVMIEVESGVYLTRTNMEKNGINDKTISEFNNKVLDFGKKHLFFSLKEFMEQYPEDTVVEYCNGSKKQLIQFIKPISNINVMEMKNNTFILSFTSEKNYRGEFIRFLMAGEKSMDIYDMYDFVKEAFGVEYPIEDIIGDIKKTDFYYSDEMEKVYKNKELFIKEVYYDGN